MKSIQLTIATLLVGPVVLLAPWNKCSAAGQGQYQPGDFPGPAESLNDYNETILQLELGKEINLNGRVFRMHYSALAPGGMILQHSHTNRPTIEYILHGTAVETKKVEDGKIVVKSVAKDETEVSTVGITHWWKNESKETVKIVAVDIWVGNTSSICRPQGAPRTEPLQPPANPDPVKTEDMGRLDLAAQFPDMAEAKDYVMRSRRLTILPKQKTALASGTGDPSITYIIAGDVWENRSDEASSIRRTGEYSVANNGISYYWENTTVEPVVLWVVDIVKKNEQ
jgi:quercetin dioxygenase-like cupin family protein